MAGITQLRHTVGDTGWDIMNEVTRARLFGTGQSSGADGLAALRNALTRPQPAGDVDTPGPAALASAAPTELGPRVAPSDALAGLVESLTNRGREVTSQLRPAPATAAVPDSLQVPSAVDDAAHVVDGIIHNTVPSAAINSFGEEVLLEAPRVGADTVSSGPYAGPRARIAEVLNGFADAAHTAPEASATAKGLRRIVDTGALPGLAGGDAALAEIAAKATGPLETMKAAFAALRATPKA